MGASSRNGGMRHPELKSSPAALVKKIRAAGRSVVRRGGAGLPEHRGLYPANRDCDERSGQLYPADSGHRTQAQRTTARRAFPEPVSGRERIGSDAFDSGFFRRSGCTRQVPRWAGQAGRTPVRRSATAWQRSPHRHGAFRVDTYAGA